jgi:dTDP-glucose pyrophosphorylase
MAKKIFMFCMAGLGTRFINEADLERDKSVLKKINLIFIDETNGQAESLYLGLSYLLEKKIAQYQTSFLAHNIDTLLLERKIEKLYKMLNSADGVIDTFHSISKNFSYVKLNKEKQVSALIEKKVVSNRASSGLYGFSSISNYINFYNKIDKTKTKELYISQVINMMIDNGSIFLDSINKNPHHTIVLGTPEEYESFISS